MNCRLVPRFGDRIAFCMAIILAAVLARPVFASRVDFEDTFDGSPSLSQWNGITDTPIPISRGDYYYLGDIGSFSLTTRSQRSVASLTSLLPPHGARGLWSVSSFDAGDVDISTVFSPVGGIDGLFSLWLLGDRGSGYTIKGGVFGGNYGTTRFADAISGEGFLDGLNGSGFLRESSWTDGPTPQWSWEYGRWYVLNIQLREASTTVSIHEEGLSSPGWSTNLPRGYTWLGGSFRLGMVQTMYVPAPGQLYLADAVVDSVRLVAVPEPASIWPSAAAVLVLAITRARCVWLGSGWTSRTRRHAPPSPALA